MVNLLCDSRAVNIIHSLDFFFSVTHVPHMSPKKKSAGQRLREFRTDPEINLKLRELADLLGGIHYNHVVSLQNGRRKPGRELANTIADVTKDWKYGPIQSDEW